MQGLRFARHSDRDRQAACLRQKIARPTHEVKAIAILCPSAELGRERVYIPGLLLAPAAVIASTTNRT
jgi:hypothetical protein